MAPGQALCAGIHFALKELQAIALMLHILAFWLLGKVTLQSGNSTAKAYSCDCKGADISVGII